MTMKHHHSRFAAMLFLLAVASVRGEAAELRCGRFHIVPGGVWQPLSIRKEKAIPRAIATASNPVKSG